MKSSYYLGLLAAWAGMVAGCASDPRPRPAIPPLTVQEEIRDSRAFLAYPDPTIGPDTGLRPPNSGVPASTR